MSTQRIYQLLLSFALITMIALLSERSRVLAAIVSPMPVKVALALWFVFTDTGGNRVLSADFCRVALFSLIPTAVFLLACWFGLRRGWPMGWTVVLGYAMWLASVGVYRGIEWWLVQAGSHGS
jgi:uncharacterized membrane protein (GlpM family)